MPKRKKRATSKSSGRSPGVNPLRVSAAALAKYKAKERGRSASKSAVPSKRSASSSLTPSQRAAVQAMKRATAAKKVKAKKTDSSSEEDEDDEGIGGPDSDEGSVTPQPDSSEIMRRPAAAARRPAAPEATTGHHFAPLPPGPRPYHGWYSSIWDPQLFDTMAPHADDVLEVCVKDAQGGDCAGVLAKVEYIEPIDDAGVTGVLRALDNGVANS